MASADGRAFTKLYRKLRCRACTANLGVEEPRASVSELCCFGQLRPGRGPLSDGRQTWFGYLAIFPSLDPGKQLLFAGAIKTELQYSVWEWQSASRVPGTDREPLVGNRGSGEVRHYWHVIGDHLREQPPTVCTVTVRCA
jgi:hypothetical protein